jgi:hypothetical protein
MKPVSITPAKRKLAEAARTAQPVEIAPATTAGGTLRIFAEVHYDADKAIAAAKRIREIGTKYKPSKKHSGAKALRDLRDDGK